MSHPEKTREDHPERSPRPANPDGDRNPGNVTQTNRSGQSRGKRLKVADLTCVVWIGVVTFEQLDSVFEETKLNKPKIQGKDRRNHDQPHHDPWKTGSGKGRKDQADEGPCDTGERLVYFLIDTHRFLSRERAGRHAGDYRGEPEF